MHRDRQNPTLAAVAAAQVSNNGTAAPQIHVGRSSPEEPENILLIK